MASEKQLRKQKRELMLKEIANVCKKHGMSLCTTDDILEFRVTEWNNFDHERLLEAKPIRRCYG